MVLQYHQATMITTGPRGGAPATMGATYHASVSRTDGQRYCVRQPTQYQCASARSWPSQGELVDEDEDDDSVPRRLSLCEVVEMAVQLMTDKTLENVIMDDPLQKWTPAQWHQR